MNKWFINKYLWTPLISYRPLTSTISISKNPPAVDVKEMQVPKPVWFYNNKSIRKRKIYQLLRKAREVEIKEGLNPREEVLHTRRLMEVFRNFEFEEHEINDVFHSKPRLLEISKKQLKKRLTNLLMLDFPKDVIKKMTQKCPSMLLIDQDAMSLQKRLNILQELNINPRLTQERCLYIIQKAPHILLSIDKSKLSSKIENLKDLGFNDLQVYELIMKQPAILTYDAKTVKDKVKYITDVLGGRLALLVKLPRTLSTSQQRLKERYEFLLKEGLMHESTKLTENKLRAIVLTKDDDFVYRITETKMKDFREFQRKLAENLKEEKND